MPRMIRSEYAKFRRERGLPGGSAPAVTYAIRSGRITVDEDGYLDPDVADRQWRQNTNIAQQRSGIRTGQIMKARHAGSDPPPPRPDRSDQTLSRAAKEYYDAELARLKFEEKQGTLVPALVVRKVLYEAGRIVRAGHDNIVGQLAPDLAAETDIATVERILKSALDALDNALADKVTNLKESIMEKGSSESSSEV